MECLTTSYDEEDDDVDRFDMAAVSSSAAHAALKIKVSNKIKQK